ncbi:MAG: response regulator [Flavobacteriales bacterium]
MARILLIEDNENIRENTAEILELAGYDMITAENGKVGVELAQKESIDLILCDIMMPELDGFGVLHILNKNPKTSSIPFIFLTAKSEKSDFRRGMNLGADDYLTKPFDETELMDAIELRLKKSAKIKDSIEKSKTPSLESFIESTKEKVKLEDLITDRNTRHYKKRETIYREGEYPHALHYIKKGKVKLSRISDYGKEFITSISSDGEFLGHLALLENSKYQEEAVTIEDSEIVSIPVDKFRELIHTNREVANNFIKLLSRNTLDMEDRLLKLAYGNVRERVAYVLNHIYEKYGNDKNDIGISISREELAGYTGIATESLIRTLSDFKSEGIISNDGRSIVVKDPAKLKRLSEGGVV